MSVVIAQFGFAQTGIAQTRVAAQARVAMQDGYPATQALEARWRMTMTTGLMGLMQVLPVRS